MLKSCLRELASHLCDVGLPQDHDNPTTVPMIPAAARSGVSYNHILTLPSLNAVLSKYTPLLQIWDLMTEIPRRRSVSKFTKILAEIWWKNCTEKLDIQRTVHRDIFL
jgi:hypothetical protein